jgi:ankyrin repeat protein
MTLEGLARRKKQEAIEKATKDEKKKVARAKKKQRKFLLLGAAHDGDLKTVRRMIEKKGVGVDKGDLFGSTATFFAAGGGHIKVLEYLLRAGADVNHIDKQGETALLVASRKSQFDAMQFLLKNGADLEAGFGSVTPLHAAASCNKVNLMEQLICQGAAVDLMSSSGDTPLIMAAANGQLDAAELLLKRGADVNLATSPVQWHENPVFRTPIFAAAGANQLRLVQFLHVQGAANWMEALPDSHMSAVNLEDLNDAERDLYAKWKRTQRTHFPSIT